MKQCFKCKLDKPLSSFYKHKQMADGHLNKCKDCTKKDSTEHRNANIEKIREYDKKRGNRQTNEYRKKIKELYPNAYRARNMTSNAIRDKKLFKEPCCFCGTEENIVAHHDDYLKPLNVRWMCMAHHSQWHRDNGDGLNKF